LWAQVIAHRDRLTASAELMARRREQQIKWMWTMLDDFWRTRIASDAKLKARLPQIEAAVAAGQLSPAHAADELVAALGIS
jgi:LAO/AO transport system kinase